MAVSRSSEARWRAHAEEGRVATGLRSRAGSARQMLHGLVGIACWIAFAMLWLALFAFNLPEAWPLIATGIVALFVVMLVVNVVWVRWNKRIYWRHDRRRQQAVVQETRFDTDALGRAVIAPDRALLMAQAAITVAVDDDDNKVFTLTDQTAPAPAPAPAVPLTPVAAPVSAGAAPVVPLVPRSPVLAMPVHGAVRIDRTPPSVPVVVGGSSDWQPFGRVEIRASGSVDTGSGLAGYQWRSSLDGGASWSAPAPGGVVAVEREGETIVSFRAVDHAGNASDWTPAALGTVRQRRLAPPVPQIAGVPPGWSAAAQVLVSAELGAEGAGCALEYRFARDDGPWSAPAPGAQVAVSAEGLTRIGFRSSVAGIASEWAESVVRLDRTPPSAPEIDGVGDEWSSQGGAVVRATGSFDALSGIAGYEFRYSLDGGASWSAPAPGAEVRVEAEGLTLVQFRALDGAGNPSPWSPEVTQ